MQVPLKTLGTGAGYFARIVPQLRVQRQGKTGFEEQLPRLGRIVVVAAQPPIVAWHNRRNHALGVGVESLGYVHPEVPV